VSSEGRTGAASLAGDSLVFLVGAGLASGVIHWGVPRLAATGIDPFAAWMLLSVPCVFVPIIGGGWLLLRSEGHAQTRVDRLRLRRLSRGDWHWAAIGVAGILVGSALLSRVCEALGLPIDPFAREPRAWAPERVWMFALWAVYWPVNILGEEVVWRGVILPRMEARFRTRAWCWNAALWTIFHVGFGAGNILVVGPALLLVPFLSQKRRSTWLGVVLHAGISLPGMIAIALGLV
jgi:membrane protease YdiL (CAAX protease family)